VAVQFVPWASAHDQFVTAIGGGQMPDVAEMGSTWTPEFGDIGALEPAELGGGGEPGGVGRFVASLVEGATVDGTVYGVPWYAGARALIYRTDVLATLGQSVPRTWDELLTVGRAIRDRTGKAAFGVAGNAAHYVLPMVWQNGGEIAYRKDGVWRSGMDSPEAVAAVQFYADLYRTEHFAPAGALSWNARDVRKAFEAGDLAMMIGGAWDLRPILAAHPELAGKVGTALLPAGPAGDRDSFAGGSHLVVFSGTKKEALARRYLDFLLDPGRVAAFTTQIGFLPGARDALAAATPHRAHGVDDVFGFEAIAAGDLGGTGVAAAERATFGEKLRPSGAMDGAVDAAAAEQRSVGSVDDCPDLKRGDIRDADFETRRADFGDEEGSGHGSMVAQTRAWRSALRVVASRRYSTNSGSTVAGPA